MACVTGDETGLVKIWDISRHRGATVTFSYGEQSRARGIASMCWVSAATDQVLLSMRDGTVSLLDLKDRLMLSAVKKDTVAANASAMSVVGGKLVIVDAQSRIHIGNWEEGSAPFFTFGIEGSAEAVHVQRRYGLVAVGGKDNDLKIYDVRSGERTEPVFAAKNVQDHILGVPYPVHIAGACIVNPYVSCVATAFHQVRFYDRRVGGRPVQEFEINREVERRPTMLAQWNCNKFLLGEASGDVHLYDTRRGFTSRAKLRGGVGSVRHMVKHPGGHQILGVVGLDRKARLYHVPTGKMIMSMYIKQRGTCLLLDRNLPMADNTACFTNVINQKVPEKSQALGDAIWDDMEPVMDEFEKPSATSTAATTSTASAVPKQASDTTTTSGATDGGSRPVAHETGVKRKRQA